MSWYYYLLNAVISGFIGMAIFVFICWVRDKKRSLINIVKDKSGNENHLMQDKNTNKPKYRKGVN